LSGTYWITEKCVHTGCQRIPQMMTELIVWDCMGLSCIHWTCYTDQREKSFGAETWLITQNLKPEKGCVIEELSSPYSKENGSIVTSKDDRAKCLGIINMWLFWICLSMVTLSTACYCGIRSVWWTFFAKDLELLRQVLSCCVKMPGIIHSTGLTSVYGCTSKSCAQCFISHCILEKYLTGK